MPTRPISKLVADLALAASVLLCLGLAVCYGQRPDVATAITEEPFSLLRLRRLPEGDFNAPAGDAIFSVVAPFFTGCFC